MKPGAATRELLKRALAIEGIVLDTADKQSASFGVLPDALVQTP